MYNREGNMTKEASVTIRSERSDMYLFLLHAACFLLVAGYVNMFQFWAWLSRQLGPGLLAKFLPIIVTLVVLLLISLRFIQRINRGYRIKFVFLGLGIVGAFLALAIPDPQVPIKRIHVAEYIILSFLVRYSLSQRMGGLRLLFFTALVSALYGVHDEMMQGLHSLRYYGWRDITVNAAAGVSGALLAHGLVCFDAAETGEVRSGKMFSAGQGMLFACLVATVVWLVIYLYQHRGNEVVYPALVPLILCSLVIAAVYPAQVFNSKKNHGLQAVFWLASGLVVYPLLAGLGGLEFR